MKFSSFILMAMIVISLASFGSCSAHLKNASSSSVKIYGNCGICETAIEKAGNVKNVAEVDWDKDTKMASLNFDSKKTSQDEILKRIALVGYDSDEFLAPDEAYDNLAACCKYERSAKPMANMEMPAENAIVADVAPEAKSPIIQPVGEVVKEVPVPALLQLKPVFDNYFGIKDALVKTDGKIASAKATALLEAIGAVKVENLRPEEQPVWAKVSKDLAFDAEHISETKDPGHQREHFSALSKNMIAIMKVSEIESPTYLQHCPMANNGKGADWLSKENAVKNPYYGSQMLSCGKTVETLK